MPDFLDRYDPDPLRYALAINLPETSDSDFSWREFLRRNNDELVATYGNLVNRVLTFVYRNFDGCVPTPDGVDASSTELENTTLSIFNEVDQLLSRCNFKMALKKVMSAATETNRFLDEKSPWKVIKEDRQAAANTLYTALNVISSLRTMLHPFLPFSSQKLHQYLGFNGKVEDYGWQISKLKPGQKLAEPKPLFTKLDEKLLESENDHPGESP